MSPFNLQESLGRARAQSRKSTRAPRSDRGSSRVHPAVLALLTELLSAQERPRMKELLPALRRQCGESRLRAPSRATVYKLMASLPCPKRRKCDLPPATQAALYNLAPESEVPLHQIAFCCFNYGDLKAASYAAGLPWLALYQAWRMRGHRPKSRGLLAAAMAARRI